MHSIMLVIDRDLPAELCDDSAAMLRELASLVSTDGESHLEKAASLSDDDRIQFSRLVDELASEFLRLEALSA